MLSLPQCCYSTISITSARLAQSVEHQTLNLRVVGSSPTLGEAFSSQKCQRPEATMKRTLFHKRYNRYDIVNTGSKQHPCYYSEVSECRKIVPVLIARCRAFVAQWLEHWSCKPGVESSNLSEGFCPKWGLTPQYHHNVNAVAMETHISPQLQRS